MTEPASRESEILVPAHIPGLEHLIEHIGPGLVAQAVNISPDSSVVDVRNKIVAIEGGTMARYPIADGDTYDLFDRLGRETITSALGVQPGASDDSLRGVIRELSRRSYVAELGLHPEATLGDISLERDRRRLVAAIEEFGLQPDATWYEVDNARIRVELGLPIDATDEEVAIAEGIAHANEWANSDHKPISPTPQWGPHENAANWRNRTEYGSSTTPR